MTTQVSRLNKIDILLGVQPSTDRTRFNTNHYTFSDKVRFYRGSPQKIGGWVSTSFSNSQTINGTARTLYSVVLQNRNTAVIGTNSFLYALYSQELTNISPLDSTATTIANSIATDYATLANNPITTVSGSGNITFADTNASKYKVGDFYTISGAATTNGILNTEINVAHKIQSIGTNTVTVRTAGTANSSGTGGGASVVRATGRLTFTAASHGQAEGDRTKITLAATTGGINNSLINLEFIVRNVTTGTFDVMTAGTATSSITGGGGASTAYQKQITAGQENQSLGQGWGVGKWGVGKWGVSQTSASGIQYPRIWFMDRFGDTILMTPGNQGKIYSWQGNVSTAPTVLANAPTDINYAFVSDNIVVTFGHQNIPNQIFASDQGDPTAWTASSLNQVYQDVIEGADRLISHVPVLGINLLFTPYQTYSFSKIDRNAGVWQVKLIDNSVGIIAPMARVSVSNVAYWMGRNNFYMWDGGNIEIIPANDQEQCTALKYVFDNINESQLSKCYAWFNSIFNEIWFHYPSSGSNECDRVVRVSRDDKSWSIDTFDRTCAEYPSAITGRPRLISSGGTLYTHEYGNDADGAAMPWTLTTFLRTNGKKTTILPGLIPDSIQTGNISVNFKGYAFPQSMTTTFDETYTVTPTTERVATQTAGRFWTITWSGEGLGQSWNMGIWQEYVQEGATN